MLNNIKMLNIFNKTKKMFEQIELLNKYKNLFGSTKHTYHLVTPSP
jgi:hypothetical protein